MWRPLSHNVRVSLNFVAKAFLRDAIRKVSLTTPVRQIAFRSTPTALRALAFHGVPDPDHFADMVRAIILRYRPVSGEDVAAALVGKRTLPQHAVWFTFDDGLRSTFEVGPMLAELGISATVFVCPSTVDTCDLLWFQVLEESERRRLIASSEQDRFSASRLKRLPDAELRREIAVLSSRLGGDPPSIDRTPGLASIRSWVASGHDLGNHTWDHPCMDQCTPEEQRRQVILAHAWLKDHGLQARFFAYPNGNWSAATAAIARELGYVGSLLFDHRLTRLPTDPDRISRLRIDSHAPIPRALGIASGAHSALFHLGVKAPRSILQRDVADLTNELL